MLRVENLCACVCVCARVCTSAHQTRFVFFGPSALMWMTSQRWTLSQCTDHRNQTCLSNTWSPWKQPSSKPPCTGCSVITSQSFACTGSVPFFTISSSSLFQTKEHKNSVTQQTPSRCLRNYTPPKRSFPNSLK